MRIRVQPNPDPDRIGTLVEVSESLPHDGDMTFEAQTNMHVVIEITESSDIEIQYVL